MKKATSKILVAAMSLIIAIGLATGTTFAWFSMNTKVTVTGMEVKTKVSSNLLIASDTLDSTAKKADNLFSATLEETVKGVLEPASTVNGTSFFYTTDAKANGAIGDGKSYVAYDASAPASDAAYTNKFSEDYGITTAGANTLITGENQAKAYVDYVFQLKAVAVDASYLNLTAVNLFDANSKDTSKAYRIAVFTEDITSAAPTGNIGTKQIFLTETGAANQTATKAVNAAGTNPTALADVSYNAYADTTNNTLAKINASETKYYKIVVRMWLEGEDTTCYNDMFVALTNSWSLELALSLESTAAGAETTITKYNTAVVSATTWYYDGTYVWNDKANVGTETGRTAKASADADVKTAFGIAA
ncbi:MAG: hypothetical protein IJU83_04290 [Clostridia bacterium]|nr:hypothetical protein [Clostridia bacterium]